MSFKGKNHSEESKRKMKLNHKGMLGKHHSEESRKKIGKNNIGRKLSNWHKEKLRQSNLGRHPSEETMEKIRIANIGKHPSEETKKKLSIIKSGKNNPMYGKPGAMLGKHHSEETKRKISISHSGEKAYNWKGEHVGIDALHIWIRKRKYKSEFCEKCGNEPAHDCANMSGEYKRDVDDYMWLCRRCHMKGDGRLEKLCESVKKQME